ncbi:MAG: sialidase family protein [Gemmataceae bacterium]
MSAIWQRGAAVLSVAVVLGTAAAADLEQTALFEAGQGGYAMYRIPGLVVTPKGTLLAYCEARKTSGDWAKIDIMMRRSADGGRSWEPMRKVVELKGTFTKNEVALAKRIGKPDEITVNNPVAIPDATTGAVHFLYCVEYARCFYQRSDDDGKTFGEPVEITATFDRFRPEYAWKVLATGPGHGIQLASGRLLVPVWLSTGTGGGAHRPSVVSTITSDDHGATWQRGEVVANETDPLVNPNETTAAQLADGRVMLNIRHESPSHRRAVAFSADGATRWTRPAFDEQLKEPICFASLCRLAAGGKSRLLFANPDNLDRAAGPAKPGQGRDRKNLTIRLSEDDGKTWAKSRVLEPGTSGYSDLAALPDGTVCCLYERGGIDGKAATQTKTLTLARFGLDWLTADPK